VTEVNVPFGASHKVRRGRFSRRERGRERLTGFSMGTEKNTFYSEVAHMYAPILRKT